MNTQDMKRIMKRIKKVREQENLTQRSLAEKADISRTFLSDLECGKKQPSFLIILKITEALEISLADLVSRKSMIVKRSRTEVKSLNQIILQGIYIGEIVPVLDRNEKLEWKILLQVNGQFITDADDYIEVYMSDAYKKEFSQKALCGDCLKIQGRLSSNVHKEKFRNSVYKYKLYAEEISIMIVSDDRPIR